MDSLKARLDREQNSIREYRITLIDPQTRTSVALHLTLNHQVVYRYSPKKV
jgi:hypothetical protein